MPILSKENSNIDYTEDGVGQTMNREGLGPPLFK